MCLSYFFMFHRSTNSRCVINGVSIPFIRIHAISRRYILYFRFIFTNKFIDDTAFTCIVNTIYHDTRGRPNILTRQVQNGYLDEWQRRAARYALRVSRSAVVSLSLLRQSRI